MDAALRNPGCTRTLLHVIPEPEAQFWRTYIYEVDDVDAKARADIDAKIEASYRPRVPPSMDFRIRMRIGHAAQQILDAATEVGADLLVLGRQGHGAFEALLFGNVAGKVARRADCPVLIVPMRDG